jgi:alpha-tubulin suppressor-like RCC1 family protein
MCCSVAQPVASSIPAGKSVRTSILAALGAVLALAACGSSGPDGDTFDPATTVVTVGRPLLLPGDTVAVTLQTRAATGEPLVIEGATVVFSAQGGSSAGAFLPVVDHQDGTYSANFVGATPGTALTITAQVNGEPVVSALPTLRVVGFTRIVAATGEFTCGIITTGDMYCWGLSMFGVRGNGVVGGDEGSVEPGFEPTLVAGGHQWTDVAAGSAHVCAVANTGVIYCWGGGWFGQLGDGVFGPYPTDGVTTPTPVSGGGTFRTVATSLSNGTCAITLASTAMCWGSGTWGRLGNGSDTASAVPVAVHGGLTFDALSTWDLGTCGVATGGSAYCWGGNGLLGIGDAPAPDTCGRTGNGGTGGDILCAKEPIAVAGGHSFRPILAATGHTVCAVATDDQTYCWGSGYLGNGTKGFASEPKGYASEPTVVSGGLSFVSLTARGVSFDAGNEYHCGTVASGVAYCWGANRSGQLGNGTTTEALVPVAVSGDHTFSQLSAGQIHICGVRTDGNAYCWGANDMGELGTRSATASLTPARVRLFAP